MASQAIPDRKGASRAEALRRDGAKGFKPWVRKLWDRAGLSPQLLKTMFKYGCSYSLFRISV